MTGHGLAKCLLDIGETARVVFLPDRKLPVGRSRPQGVVGATVLIPGARRLAQLVAELRRIGVLGLPAHQPRPVGKQGLVDDLHPPGGFAFLISRTSYEISSRASTSSRRMF